MAFTDTSVLDTDIEVMETEFGAASTVTLSGTAYPCLLDVQVNSQSFEDGGLMYGYAGRFYLRTSETSATIGQECIIGGVTYRVGPEISKDPDGVGAWYKYRELT
jgi:hypothetical protein